MANKICSNEKCRNTIGLDDDKFCYRCGFEMYDLGNCECGRELGSSDRYCGKCGKRNEKVPL